MQQGTIRAKLQKLKFAFDKYLTFAKDLIDRNHIIMELSKYIEAIKAALAGKLGFPGVATVEAFMSSEGNLHGGNVAIDGKNFSLGKLFAPAPVTSDGVRVRFNISVS